jgi:antitoxin component YwqK of YwqJK toxin-antitoxin module
MLTERLSIASNTKKVTKAGTALSYHPNGKLKIKEQASMTGQDWVIEEYTDTDKLMSVKRFKNKQPKVHGFLLSGWQN